MAAQETRSAHSGSRPCPITERWVAQYEGLVYTDAEYRVKPRLAEEFSHKATADEWTVRVGSGVEFHRGKTLSADDVLFSLRKTLDPSVGSFAAGFVSIIDIANSVKIDDRPVRIKLTKAAVDFPEFLNGVAMVPTDYDEVSSHFEPGVRRDFVRHENYWQNGKPYLDELTILGFSDENTRVNAPLSGQITGADTVDFTLAKLLENRAGVVALRQHTNNFIPYAMRTEERPFNDARVREAFKLIIDRQALIDWAFMGLGQIASDLYARSDPFFAGDLPPRHQDLDKARHLLKAAGAEDLKGNLTTTDMGGGMNSMSQLIAAQVKEAGVQVSVTQLDITTYTGPGLGSSHFANKELDQQYYRASAETDDTKRRELVHRMQQIQSERGGLLIPAFYDTIDGHSSQLGGERRRVGIEVIASMPTPITRTRVHFARRAPRPSPRPAFGDITAGHAGLRPQTASAEKYGGSHTCAFTTKDPAGPGHCWCRISGLGAMW